MVSIVCNLVFGSFYLSYGVIRKSIEEKNKAIAAIEVNENGVTDSQHSTMNKMDTIITTKQQQEQQQQKEETTEPLHVNSDKCAFRSYPKSRLYGLHDNPQPNFLSSDATYIRGELPIILNPLQHDDSPMATTNNSNDSSIKSIQQSKPVKPCFDTTSWETLLDKSTNRNRLPFTDGHNPSVVSLASNPYTLGGHTHDADTTIGNHHVRLHHQHLGPISSAFPSYSLDKLFLGVTIFGNGQCKFGLSEEEVTTYNFSPYNDPPSGKRTIIAVMTPPMPLLEDDDDHTPTPFQILGQTTLLLERDVDYGTKRRKIGAEANPNGEGYKRIHQEFDDPRFFFHGGRLWVLYRNGPLFGYQDQIQNPVHFEVESGDDDDDDGEEEKFIAYVKASETVRVCCGRNIALISEEAKVGDSGWMPSGGLKALTWVDPVTVVDVDLGDVSSLLKDHRQLSESVNEEVEDAVWVKAGIESSEHRRLGAAKKPKSNIHGTNGYLVPLPSTGELLGIAHFHRPEHRKESTYALHGHHYTHAFFTIARQQQSNNNGGDNGDAPFILKRISNEFLFRALSMPIDEKDVSNDGDIIQFASGLDVYGCDIHGKLILSYGINDCEGAVMTISMEKLQKMLIEVEPGQEVVDLMRKAESTER